MEKCLNCFLVAFAAFFLVFTKGVHSGRVPKAGVCPNLPPPSHCSDKYDFCSTDADCRLSNYKCCSNGCKKICAVAVPNRITLKTNETDVRVRLGDCPPLPIRKFCFDHESHYCSNDFDCNEYYKCCSNGCTRKCVVSTSKIAIESGSKKTLQATCPHFPTKSSNCPVDVSNQCSADNDCSDQGDSFKCCWDGCRKICLDPSEIQQTEGRGSCPVMRRQTTCTSFQHECIADKECSEGKKCCSDGCTKKCVNAKDSTSAVKNVTDTSLLFCPIPLRPEVCPSDVNDTCNSLGDCASGQKCCHDGCNFRCFGKSGFQPEKQDPHAIPSLLSEAEVVFVMDTSDGPRGSEFELQKSFATSLTRFFDLGPNKVHVAIVSSGHTTKVIKHLSPYVTHSDFQSYMKSLSQQGRGRNLDKVFQTVEEDILSSGRRNVPRIVIIFSFGLPSSSVWNLLTAVRGLHSRGVMVFTIGIDVQEDEPQLRALVSRPQDLFTFRNSRELENAGGVFASYIEGRSENVVPEYFAADIIFLVDSSNSVGRQNLTKVQKFILSMARALNVGPKKSRVSIITFGDVVAEITANFGSLRSINSIDDALEKMIYLGGDSNIGRALEKIPEILDKARSDVRKVALMVTDRHHIMDDVNLKEVMLPLSKRDLEMYALVVGGGQVGVRRLHGLASRPTDVFSAYNYDILQSRVAPIAKYIVNGPPPTTVGPTTTALPTTTTSAPTTVELQTTTEDEVTNEVPTTIPTTNVPTSTENPTTTTIPDETTTIEVPTTHYVAAGNRPTTPKRYNKPAPAKGQPKPGICPMVSRLGIQCPSTDQCGVDQDCAGNKKCCSHYCRRKVCVEPPSKEEEERLMSRLHRPGKCRKLKRPIVCQKKTNVECNYDVDCINPTHKCCSDGCHRRCVDAVSPGPVLPVDPPKPNPVRPGNILGRCPPYSPDRNCPKLVQDDCTCSSDCGSGYKCCFDGCKRICRRPAGNECTAQLDIVYLMDTSGSISLSDYDREKQFVKDLARIFRVADDGSQAAVTIYNDDPHEVIKLGDHSSPEEFSKAIDDIKYLHGRTRIDKALKSALETFQDARPNIRKVLVLLTDGRQTQDPDSVPLNLASQPLKDMGVKIYAVGVGQKIDKEELENITGNPADVFTVDSFTALLGESQTIAAKACGDVIGKICIRGVDLGFIVDSSESITDDDFIKEKKAIKAISDEFVIAPKSTRVGVVVYSNQPQINIDFDQYTSNSDFNRAVNTLPHLQSHTRLDMALRYAASKLYNKRRQANPAIAIVMTDGKQTPGAESLSTAVKPLRDLGVRIFAVAVGPRASQKEMREIVQSYDDVFTVDSFSQLIKEAKKITERACPAPSETKLPITESPTTALTTPSASPSPSPSPSPSAKPDTLTNPCSYFLDIIFVLDSSRSMDVRQYVKQKEFVKKLARIFNVGKGSRAAAIIYSDDPILSIDFDLFNTQEGFLDGVDKLPYIMQRTRIDKALKMASEVLKDSRPGFPKAVIIMTDGRQTRDPDYTPLDTAAAPLHREGARVLVVGIGPAISVDELGKMVKNNKTDIFTVKSFDGLVNATSDVAIKSCQAPPKVLDSCPDTFDLAFVMDSSGSMQISSYNKEKRFVKNIAGRFAVGPNKVALGLLTFSDWPSTLVEFGSSSSMSIDLFNVAVDGAKYLEGRTRIDRALKAASDLFKLGRSNVTKVMVFLTDGRQSSDPGFIPIETAMKSLIEENVQIIVVGIGKNIDTKQLYTLASQKGRDVTQVSSFDDLEKLKNSFAQTICRKIEEVIQSGSA